MENNVGQFDASDNFEATYMLILFSCCDWLVPLTVISIRFSFKSAVIM